MTQRCPTSHGWTRPGERTTDQGRFLTSPSVWRSQLRAQRRSFAGFPLNRPRQPKLWAAPWSLAAASRLPLGLSNRAIGR